MRFLSIWLAVCCVLFFSGDGYSATRQSYEDIYQKVFKKPFVKVLTKYDSTLIINGKPLGTVALEAAATGPIDNLRGESFIEYMRGQVNPVAFSELQQMMDSQGYILERRLSEAGYILSFNRRGAYLTVSIPTDKRNEIVYIDLRSRGATLRRGGVSDKSLSGYLNLNGSWSRFESNSGEVVDPLSVDMESVVNIGGVAFRQVGNLTVDDPVPYALSAVQMVSDDTSNWTRYELGDITLPFRGLQGNPRIFGVGMGRLYYLDPTLVDQGNQNLSIKVEKKGRLSLKIGGWKLENLSVDRGTYILQNLPLLSGVNLIDISIIYDDGTKLRRTERMVRDYGTIGVGDSDYYYMAGVFSDSINRDYKFGSDRMVISAYHLVRPTEFWLQGGYFQAGSSRGLVGVDTYFPVDSGRIHMDGALSFSEVSNDSGAVVDFTTYYDSTGTLGYQKVALSYFGEDFRRIGDVTEQSLFRSFTSEVGVNVGPQSILSLRGSIEEFYNQSGTFVGGGVNFYQQWNWLRSDMSTSYSKNGAGVVNFGANGNLRASFAKEWLATVQLRLQNIDQVSNSNVSFFLTWMPQSHRVAVGTQGDGAVRSEYGYRNGDGLEGSVGAAFAPNGDRQTDMAVSNYDVYSNFQANSTFSQRNDTDDSRFFVRYGNTRGVLDVSHTQSASRGTNSFSNVTSYRLGTAIAFADGKMAVSKPIRRNFVLVYPEKELESKTFKVGANGLVDWFGPAVITDMQLWTENRIEVGEIRDLPDGYDLGLTRYKASLGFYGGKAIRVGNGRLVQVFGRAMTSSGPVSYTACDVFEEATPALMVARILTGSDGKFLIQGLKPGKYGIKFRAYTDDLVYFEIPDTDKDHRFDMGDITLKSN